jgi:hypothetical protein
VSWFVGVLDVDEAEDELTEEEDDDDDELTACV